ncbi:MAG: phosphate ABC transporter substrate-binding protein [Syntrophales bacterium]|nr:phosphate ABC transporter substrate-binding protein [Syntrophales bacterium]MDD5640911.1 phosphate ABC transporter substrate-binding protein [Syntrophales bacterium]
MSCFPAKIIAALKRRQRPGFEAGLRGSFWPAGKLLRAGILLLSVLLFLGPGGCRGKTDSTSPAICVAGSTSVQPFAEKLAEVYMEQHSRTRIDVQGGGSSAGIFAAQQGAADLGASSRELVQAEKALHEIPIAWDGIAVIVHPSNPLNNLTLKQLRRIFQGRITNWRDLGLPPHAIDLISREEGSGTREAFEHLAMGKTEVSHGALVQDSNGAVREIVAGDPYSLGYISAGLVDNRVKAVAIDGILPTRENIKTQKYKLVRRFLLVSRKTPSGQCRAFVDFILSPQGQRLLEAEGLVGVK